MRRMHIAAILLVALFMAVSPWQRHAPAQNNSTVEVTARRFGFSPAELTLKRGQPVTLILTSQDVAHGLSFRDLGVDIRADKGKSTARTFTPEKLGDFVGHCSVFCGSGHGSMTLTLHVVE